MTRQKISVTNSGGALATGVELTSASLVIIQGGKPVTIPTSTKLPAAQNSLVPGGSTTLTLTFPPLRRIIRDIRRSALERYVFCGQCERHLAPGAALSAGKPNQPEMRTKP